MIVLITYINLLNLSWIKCLFLRNMKPLTIEQIIFLLPPGYFENRIQLKPVIGAGEVEVRIQPRIAVYGEN